MCKNGWEFIIYTIMITYHQGVKKMKQSRLRYNRCSFYILLLTILVFSLSNAMAADKVVVIPLNAKTAIPSIKRTVSISANALSHNTATITPESDGLLWKATYSGGASVTIKAPADYAGGDVNFYIFFKTKSATEGKVAFFLRPTSNSSGDGTVDPGSLNSDEPVDVSGKIGFGTVYQQSFVIPEDKISGDWWFTGIQREGQGATYPDDVLVRGVAFEYQAVQ